LLLAFGTSLGHLRLVFLLFTFRLRKLFLHAPIFFGGSLGRQHDTILADQLLYRFTIRQRINFVDFCSFLFQFAFAVDLAISLSLLESVFGNAVLELILVALDFTEQCSDVEILRGGWWIEDVIVDAGVVLDALQQERQLTRSVNIHANAVRFENAPLRLV